MQDNIIEIVKVYYEKLASEGPVEAAITNHF